MGLVGGKIKFQIKNEELEAASGGGFLNFSGGGGAESTSCSWREKQISNFKFQIKNEELEAGSSGGFLNFSFEI
jgi:hypothetical protein